MSSIAVKTEPRPYEVIVERGILARAGEYVPKKAGKIFVVTNNEVWKLHGETIETGLAGRSYATLFLPAGEERKRLAPLESLAEEMVLRSADRTSLVLAFGGGIVNDMGGFLAAIFMRGIPVIQVPTTLLAQVDASIGGKTGVNLASGKNLIGSFHQPLAVLIDPAVLGTLPDREFRAGMYEIVKAGIIRSPELFHLLAQRSVDILARKPEVLDRVIEDAVRIKADVVSSDEREGDERRILNFGHTFGHALEAETQYSRFLHGEAVAWGMRAAIRLASLIRMLPEGEEAPMVQGIERYGPIPPLGGIAPEKLLRRLVSDKKTIQGNVHFVLPDRLGHVRVVSGVDERHVRAAIESTLA